MGTRVYKQEEMSQGRIYVGKCIISGDWIPIIASRIYDRETGGMGDDDTLIMVRIDSGAIWSAVGDSSIVDWYQITAEFAAALKKVVDNYEARSQ